MAGSIVLRVIWRLSGETARPASVPPSDLGVERLITTRDLGRGECPCFGLSLGSERRGRFAGV